MEIVKKYKLSIVYENGLVPQGIKDESVIAYSGGLKRTGTIVKGLTEDEEEYLLPSRIGVSYNDNTFRQRADEYWCNLDKQVTAEGLLLDGSYTLDSKNRKVPTKFEDYVLINMLLNDDNVSKDVSTTYGYKWLLVDIEGQKQKEESKFANLKIANRHLSTLLADETSSVTGTLRDIVVFYREKLNLSLQDIDNMNRLNLEMAVSKFATDEPDRFMKVSQNETLKFRAFIKRLEEAGIVSLVGKVYFDKSENMGDQSQFAKTLQDNEDIYVKYQNTLLEINK